MLPGPVFNVELITTARRPRYYAVRVLYGSVLLVLVWQNYASWDRYGGANFDPRAMRSFAMSTFLSMAGTQVLLVMGMTPSLVAGVIANEKQRKTLHYLLASELSSGEIVLGKLMARMLHVAVFLGIGLPILSLLTLFGGVDPVWVAFSAAGTLSIAFFLASLSVLCSTVAKRVREAISVAYMLEGFWLVFPWLLRTSLATYYPRTYDALKPFIDWWMATTPWSVLSSMSTSFRGTFATPLVEAALWMIGLQLALGSLFVAFAVWRLRPVFKAQEGARAFRFLGIPLPGSKTGRVRLFGKRPVGDAAMWWKELYTSRTSGAAQVVMGFSVVAVVGAVAYWTWVFGAPAFEESRKAFPAERTQLRADFNGYLRTITTGIGLISILAVAIGGANVLTSEREDDTWISLIATPMEGPEIVVPKMVGVVWKVRWALLGILALDLAGILCHALHPMGVLFQGLELAAYLAFATGLGTFCSLRAKSTWRSQATTTGVLFTVGGGYLACCCPVAMQGRPSMLILSGCIPFLLPASAVAPWEFSDYFLRGSIPTGPTGDEITQVIQASLVGTIAYGVAGAALGFASVMGFDRAAGRPRRDEFASPPPPPPAPAEKKADEVP